MLIWIALLKDDELTCNEVLCAQTSFEKLETYVKDWFGISETKTYTSPAEFLGYTEIEYSEFEGDLNGYFTFKEDELITEVYVFCKVLDQAP